MRRGLRRVVLLTAVGAVGLFATGGAALGATEQSPGPEPGSPEQMEYFADTCRKELQRPPIGGVENVTSPGPGTIVAGDVVDISLSWDPADWTDTWVEKVLNCVSVDGVPAPELTDEERPAPNDGAYGRELAVPDDIDSGHLLCQQGFVYGMFARGGYTRTSSPRVCFTTEAAPPPPPPPPPTTTTEPPTTTTTEPPTTTTTEAPPRVAAAAPEAPEPAPVPVRTLPKTGPGDRVLLIAAGGALALGGLGVAAGARKRRASSPA
jgi:LPXTG-motif cell wall-anchored protein